MLVGPIGAVEDRAAEAADQKFLEPDQFQIQVGTAFHTRQGVFGVVVRVMVAWYVEQWNIQQSQQVLQVRVWQVSTAEDQLDLAEVTVGTKAVQTIDNLIAYCKNFHNECIVPQNEVPCKGFHPDLMYETEMLPTPGWLSKGAQQTIIY